MSNETKSGNTVSSLVQKTKQQHPRRPILQRVSGMKGLFSIGAALYVATFLTGIFAGGLYAADISLGIVATGALALGFMKYPNQELNTLSSKIAPISKLPVVSKITSFLSRISKYPQILAIVGATLATIESAFFAQGATLGVAAPVFGVIAIALTVLPMLLSKTLSSKLTGGLYFLATMFIWLNGYGAPIFGWFFSLFILGAEYEAFKTVGIVENR